MAKPNLRIENLNLLCSNESLLEGQTSTTLTADASSASGTLTVAAIEGFSVGKYALLGNFGEATAEIVRIHASTAPSGTTITLNANTAYDHAVDTPLTIIEYNQIEYSRAATSGGTKSVLATQSIQPTRLESNYTDLTNTTGFGTVRFKNSTSTTYSEYSDEVNYTGLTYQSVNYIVREACAKARVTVGSDYATEDQLLMDANEAQDMIAQTQDWIFELVKNDTSIASTENEHVYALSGLTYAMKYTGTPQGCLDVRFADGVLDKLSIDDMDKEWEGVVYTTLSSGITAGDTSITLSDSYEFAENGTVYAGANSAATYTTNTESTGVLSGFSATAFTSDVSSGANVYQGVSPGKPSKYAIFDGNIILDVPVETDEVGKKLKFKYLKALTRFTTFASTTEIPFPQALSYYVAANILQRKGNAEEANLMMARFQDILMRNASIYKLPTLDYQQYYNFSEKTTSSTGGTTTND